MTHKICKHCQPVRDPLLEPYAWRVWPAVELASLQEASQQLVGAHDFAAFGTSPQAAGQTVRVVLQAGWKLEQPYLVFEITAQAFLYHMVRRLVFMQVAVAQGKLSRQALQQALKTSSATLPGEGAGSDAGFRLVHGLAPAQGLVLTEVHYPTEALRGAEDKN